MRMRSLLQRLSMRSMLKTSKVNMNYRTTQFLDWFYLRTSREEEKNSADLIQKMELFGSDPKALYLLDREFCK